jgi:hypothetical protein
MATAPPTSTPSFTNATATATPVLSPQPGTTPVIYPNPSNGGPVNVLPPAFKGLSEIRIQIFTTAFRKVLDVVYPQQLYGPITLTLDDSWGKPLANGLYYVVIQTSKGRAILKLLVLR